jgi:hypothetical protein
MLRRLYSAARAIAATTLILGATLVATPAAAATSGFQPLPTLPVNACGDPTLPRTSAARPSNWSTPG